MKNPFLETIERQDRIWQQYNLKRMRKALLIFRDAIEIYMKEGYKVKEVYMTFYFDRIIQRITNLGLIIQVDTEEVKNSKTADDKLSEIHEVFDKDVTYRRCIMKMGEEMPLNGDPFEITEMDKYLSSDISFRLNVKLSKEANIPEENTYLIDSGLYCKGNRLDRDSYPEELADVIENFIKYTCGKNVLPEKDPNFKYKQEIDRTLYKILELRENNPKELLNKLNSINFKEDISKDINNDTDSKKKISFNWFSWK